MEESIKTPQTGEPAGRDFRELMARELKLRDMDLCTYSPLVLAYIGDAVYELFIRTRVVNQGSMQVSKMHKKSAELVKAQTTDRPLPWPNMPPWQTTVWPQALKRW